MQLTVKHDTLAAIRALVDYVKEDEREDYQEQVDKMGYLARHGIPSVVDLEQGDARKHVYETIAEIRVPPRLR